MSKKKRAPKRRTTTKSAKRLAGTRIDQLEDSTATRPEKARRKRRLLEGPEEFRTYRTDLAGKRAKRPRPKTRGK